MTLQIVTESGERSEQLGASLGARLKGGEVIELVSDLGGGKTTFTRGLTRGAGSADQVSSPTFTLRNEYRTKGFTIYHFDFYRLSEPGIMADEMAEVVGDKNSVVVVEWGDIVGDVLPQERLTINIKATGENARELSFGCPSSYKYLIDGLK